MSWDEPCPGLFCLPGSDTQPGSHRKIMAALQASGVHQGSDSWEVMGQRTSSCPITPWLFFLPMNHQQRWPLTGRLGDLYASKAVIPMPMASSSPTFTGKWPALPHVGQVVQPSWRHRGMMHSGATSAPLSRCLTCLAYLSDDTRRPRRRSNHHRSSDLPGSSREPWNCQHWRRTHSGRERCPYCHIPHRPTARRQRTWIGVVR